MLKVLKFGPAFGVPDPSSFVLKLETYLRLAEIDYRGVRADVRKAPKAKFPVLVDGENSIADSQFAIQYLKKNYGDKLNDGVSAKELAQHHMLRLALENHSYFMMLITRWLDPENAVLIKEAFFSDLGFMGPIIFKIVQSGMRRTIEGQGLLRHSEAELNGFIKDDVHALETLLGEQPYFGGETPREIDATTFAFISNMVVPEMNTPQKLHGRRSQALVEYNNRMALRLFPDYKETMIIKPEV